MRRNQRKEAWTIAFKESVSKMEKRKEAVECNGEERQKVHFKKKKEKQLASKMKCYFTSLLLIQLKPNTLYTKQTKIDSERI